MSSAYAIGDRALVSVGCSAWSGERRHLEDDLPLGGVVVEIFDLPPNEDGERRRAFRCIDPYVSSEVRTHVLREDEVDAEALEQPMTARCVQLVRRLCATVATTKRRRGNLLLPEEAQHVADAHRLVKVVMGG